jgi:tripartite-type tricarboxylate transporter receptor subunit TctC
MNRITRRTALVGLSAFAIAPAFADEGWPNRPISLLTGYAAGGPTDTLARIVGEGLRRRLGEAVVIESKPGAAGTLAAAQLARATPDGYTLILLASGFATTAAMYRKLPYRPLEDFSMIGLLAEFPFVIATYADHPIGTAPDLLAQGSSNSKPLLYGTSGNGSNQHLAMELLAKMANLLVQHVPYRGGAAAIVDLLGKRLDFVVDPPSSLLEFINQGKLRALATTGASRHFSLPDVPTVAEAGVAGYRVLSWHGLAGPVGLPVSVSDRLAAESAATLAEPTLIEQFKALGISPKSSGAGEFRLRIAADIRAWNELIDSAGIERI